MQIHELNKQPTNTLLTEKDVNEVSQAKLASIRKKAVAEKAKDTAEYQRAINKALPADPGTNQQAQPTQQQAAQQPAPVQQAANPAQPAIVSKKPSMWNRAMGVGKAVGQSLATSVGIDPRTGQATSSQYAPMYTKGIPQATLMSKLAPAGITQKELTFLGQTLQQASNNNKILTKTNDKNVDAFLTSLGYKIQ